MAYFVTTNYNHVQDIIGHRMEPGKPPVSLGGGYWALELTEDEKCPAMTLGEGEIVDEIHTE